MNIRYEYELTDTWGGHPNYGWVKRGTITVPMNATQHKIMREVKKALLLTGVKFRLRTLYNGWEFKPDHSMAIGWITIAELDEAMD